MTIETDSSSTTASMFSSVDEAAPELGVGAERVKTGNYASVELAAAHFGVAEDFIYDIASEMNLAARRAFKAGGKWHLDLADVEAYLIERTRERQTTRGVRRRTVAAPSMKPSRIRKSW